MLRKNTASQFVHFTGVNATTGAALSGASWTGRKCLDGTFSSLTATVTEDGATGFYKVALAAGDTNANICGYQFTATNAVPVAITVVTTVLDPTSVAFGLSIAKTTNITGFNDIAATAVVSSGAITTAGGAVSTVTTLTNLPSIPANWLTAAGIAAAALNGKGDWNIGKTGYALTSAEENAIADALLDRDMAVGTDTASRRSLRNALRKLINKWSISGTTLTVTKEDDTTTAYTQTLTSDAAAEPITSLDTN